MIRASAVIRTRSACSRCGAVNSRGASSAYQTKLHTKTGRLILSLPVLPLRGGYAKPSVYRTPLRRIRKASVHRTPLRRRNAHFPFAFSSDLRPIIFRHYCADGESGTYRSPRFFIMFSIGPTRSSLSGSTDERRRARPICGTCNVSAYLYRAGHTDGKRVARTRAEDSVHVLAVLCGKLNGNECLNGSGKSAAVYTPCRART